MSPTPDNQWIAPFRKVGPVELLTDEPSIALSTVVTALDRVDLIKARDSQAAPCNKIEETQLAKLFATAVDRLSRKDLPGLLWIHTSNLVRTWDAPRDLAIIDDDSFDDDWEDSDELSDFGVAERRADQAMAPRPPAVFMDCVPPSFRVPDDSHPDLIVSWMRTYGCQVRLLDMLIRTLLMLETCRSAQVVLAGTSGFALGEQGWFGANAGPLRSNRVRLPLLISGPTPLRVPTLVSSSVVPILLQLMGRGKTPLISAEMWLARESEYSPIIETNGFSGEVVRTTPRWCGARDGSGKTQLYLKPDDINDVNDIASLRTDVVHALFGETSEG
jgi:hypothetical protein